MMVSTRGRYALRVMIDLAECPKDKFIPLAEISNRQGISEKYLESIVSSLSKAEFVLAARGKKGGYMLARSPEEYTVSSILHLTEKNMAPVACLGCDSEICERASDCKTLPMWKELDKRIEDYLSGVTLADLVNNTVGGSYAR